MKITDISDNNMFWGVTLEGGKRYAQTVQKSFHISMAALEPHQGKTFSSKSNQSSDLDGKHTSVMINHDKAEFLLCTLTHARLYQQPLDLNFTEGEEVTFFLNGPGIVHLTGYLTPEEPLEDEMEMSDDEADSSYVEEESSEEDSSEERDSDEEEDSDGEVPKLKPIKFSMDTSSETSPEKSTKRKKKQTNEPRRKKKKKLESEEEDEEEESGDEEDSEEYEEDSDEMDEDDEDDSEWETEESNFIDDEAEEAESDKEESEDDDEDEHMVATSGSFLQPQKSKVKKEMEKFKKDKQKESPKKAAKALKEEPQSPKESGEQPTENGTPETNKKKKRRKKKKKNKQKGDDDNTATNTSKSQANASNISNASTEKAPKPRKRTIKGGTNVEDHKEGHGPEATSGKTVAVYYTGKLDSGKQFDACTSGKPFKFKLGKGEVIKGWDSGVAGMKVGGKRKLIIPPSQGYGNQKMGSIPRNSTLHFEIELKAVS